MLCVYSELCVCYVFAYVGECASEYVCVCLRLRCASFLCVCV